ncbi:MAG: hypothetical protein GVY07_04280 [Bacteroidetes bacterium]|jgi:sugar lactone lactonase YvrE|nr:hypothetical protein [Bacteroidota bacterium]
MFNRKPGNFKIQLFFISTFVVLMFQGCSENSLSDPSDENNFQEEEIFTVETIAGNSRGYIDEEIGKARFNNPWGIALNSNNEIYIGDSDNAVIRIITSEETVETFAGRGYGTGFIDGAWNEALFAQPMGVELGVNGILYIADSSNHAIRIVTQNGRVETYSGVGLSGDQDGPREQARFTSPADLAISSNLTIYIADGLNYKIRKISNDGIVSTVSGTGVQGFNDGTPERAQFALPVSIALGPGEEYLYVADFFGHRIRKVEISTGNVSTVAGNGQAGFADGDVLEARLNRPAGIDVGKDGTIYFSDSANHAIRMIRDNTVSTLAGNGELGSADGVGADAQFNKPYHLVLSKAETFLYISDWENHLVRRLRLRN